MVKDLSFSCVHLVKHLFRSIFQVWNDCFLLLSDRNIKLNSHNLRIKDKHFESYLCYKFIIWLVLWKTCYKFYLYIQDLYIYQILKHKDFFQSVVVLFIITIKKHLLLSYHFSCLSLLSYVSCFTNSLKIVDSLFWSFVTIVLK